MNHYDRAADIVRLALVEGYDAQHSYGEPQPWGLLERDRETGQLVAVEFWQASEHLPIELLDALQRPHSRGEVTIGRDQRVAT